MRFTTAVLILLVSPGLLHAQIRRDNYYFYVPSMPKLVTETLASQALHLYGDQRDAAYADGDGNGIDDRRQAQLLRIADRFSPVLRRNNFSFPRDFKQVLGDQDILFADTWAAGHLAKSEGIRLGWSGKAFNETDGADARLIALLADVDPTKRDARFIRPDDYEERTLFVDFPGDDPVSWRIAYRDADPKLATIYTHFFIHEDSAARGPARYYLVAQHWFFYPFDDAANNHEGDWEHMNVLITTGAAVAADERGRLTETELQAVLNGDSAHVQSLMIAFVDYYFHENVFTLAYLPAYRPTRKDADEKPWIKRVTVWREPTYIKEVVRARLTADSGVLASHPIGFIGGDNKGPDELFSIWPRFGNAYNRNGHGTYAFPGTWQSVGAMASTEQIDGAAVPVLRAGSERDTLAHRMVDPMFVMFANENIVLVPDWERVNALFATDARTRRDWNWLVLPMRWGFPASVSPGGGALAHTDFGNISPEGPAFQPTWNRVGTAAGWRSYDAEVLSVMLAPITPWDRLKSGWGILNVPVALFGFLPGWNVAVTQLMPWVTGTLHAFGAPPPRTFRPVNTKARFTTMTAGVYVQSGGRDFALLLPVDSSPAMAGADLTQSTATAMRYGMQLYYGQRISIENTFAQADRTLGVAQVNESGLNLRGYTTVGTITTKDLTGGARYDVVQSDSSDVHLFLRGGWGWTWYKVRDVKINGNISNTKIEKGYGVSILPSQYWWPNSWYAGAGVEYFAPHRAVLFPQLGYGVRAEVTASRHRLGATKPGERNLGVVSRYEVGLAAVIGW